MRTNRVQPQMSGNAHLQVGSLASTGAATSVPRQTVSVRSSTVTPSVVQAVTILWGLMLVATGFAMTIGLLSIIIAERSTYNFCAVAGPLFALVVWFGRNLNARTRLVWKVQAGLSMLGILCFPIGTIINAIILAAWFSPETKAWFGVD